MLIYISANVFPLLEMAPINIYEVSLAQEISLPNLPIGHVSKHAPCYQIDIGLLNVNYDALRMVLGIMSSWIWDSLSSI